MNGWKLLVQVIGGVVNPSPVHNSELKVDVPPNVLAFILQSSDSPCFLLSRVLNPYRGIPKALNHYQPPEAMGYGNPRSLYPRA